MSFKFASQGVSLCCAAVKITKTSQETRGFFGAEFLGFGSSFLKYQKFFKLGARKFFFSKYKKPFKSGFSHFSSSENYFLKWKRNLLEMRNRLESSIPRNIRKFLFLKYKKVFLSGNRRVL